MGVKAFPGAYGWGAETVGGRGGVVIPVNNLNDSGLGSFRQAVEVKTGPRIVVFNVGGTLRPTGEIFINPFCTIAAQTAPGGGFCIHSSRDLVMEDTEEIIIRYLRIRSKGTTSDQDTVQILHSHHIILDHCSIIWGTDESISWNSRTTQPPSETHHITMQWCLVGDGADDTHNRPADIGRSEFNTLHHNLILHGQERNPKINCDEPAKVDFTNNVIYNWKDAGTQLHNGGDYDVINNFYKAGNQSTNPGRREIYHVTLFRARTYIVGNVGPSDPTGLANWGSGMIRLPNGTILDTDSPNFAAGRVAIPPNPPPLQTAQAAYDSVLADVGANRQLNADGTWCLARDSVDELLIDHVKNGTGDHIVNDISERGGAPTLTPGIAYTDADSDGMADEWEVAQGLDPADPADGPIVGPDGYSNLELFLNSVKEKPVSVVTDLEAVEAALRQEILDLTTQADAVAKAITDLKAVDDALDAAADVIEAD